MRFRMLLCLLSLLAVPCFVFAQQPPPSDPVESKDVKGTVLEIDRTYELRGVPQMEFDVMTDEGERYHIDTGTSYTEGVRYRLKEGTRVQLQLLPKEGGGYDAYLSDVVRTPHLLWIFFIFAALSVLIGRSRGFLALVGLAITLLILFVIVFPLILKGHSPVLVTLVGSILILAVNMHLSHGMNRRTFFAFLSTVSGLLSALVFAELFLRFAFLSGLATEDATMLYWQTATPLLPTGILLAGILLGATGVLDDIAITQTETVAELQEANPHLQGKELYTATMRIGRHHIASTVNTLVLAYAGASLPLFLLFMTHPDVTALSFINIEPVAEELVRTIAGTMGLLLTVPISTAFAVFAASSNTPPHAHKHT